MSINNYYNEMIKFHSSLKKIILYTFFCALCGLPISYIKNYILKKKKKKLNLPTLYLSTLFPIKFVTDKS